MKNYIKFILINTIIFMFTACDSSSYTLISDKLNGIVVDGYINGATVCIDTNTDGSCEDETIIITGVDGEFSFKDSNFYEDTLTIAIASNGIDTSTGKVFDGEIKRIIDSNLLDENSVIVISPITDLVAVSFLNSQNQDKFDLEDAKDKVASLCEIPVSDLYKDPMKDINIFMKSQLLQYTKSLTLSAIKKNKNPVLTQEEEFLLQNDIKQEILNWDADIGRVLIAIEVKLNVSIPQNEKTFVINQIDELKNALNTLSQDTSLSIENLYRLQKLIDIKMQEAEETLQAENTNADIEILKIDLSVTALTQTIFEITNATLDEQACVATNGYNSISDTSFDIGKRDDVNNGISINSSYDFGESIQNNEVSIFYTDLQNTLTQEKVIVFEDNYYFVFDEAWLDNSNKTIYIKTPKNDSGLYSCYKFKLDTTSVSDMVGTKVFRYSDI